MKLCTVVLAAAWLLPLALAASGQEARVRVRPDNVLHRISRYLTGACIEDVNHEIYGGIYSQMIFGESFQEPAPTRPPKGFTAYGGPWVVRDGVLDAGPGDGPKLVAAAAPFSEGEVSVELRFDGLGGGNSGVLVKLANPGVGADNFDGYEVSLDTGQQALVLGRHRHNWEPISTTPCPVPAGEWLRLTVRTTATTIEADLNGRNLLRYEDREHPLAKGGVALRPWQRRVSYRNLRINGADVPFIDEGGRDEQVSGMWRAVRRGSAQGSFAIQTDRPFVGEQCQLLTFASGEGAVGVENRGLNRWGLHFEGGKAYEGVVYARAERAAELVVSLESGDGAQVLAERRLKVRAGDWQRLTFNLKPNATVDGGRFAISLRMPGSVDLGYAFLQPGAWGRFKGLPCRKDVVEGLIAQGVTVLRYGGSMINHGEYRWKKMVGPRELRPPYHGTWYRYSTNGWGILDFVDMCEKAGFDYIPAFNMDETPQDMADFVEYVNGPADSEWGKKRAAAGHPEPYHLKYLQLGNEEKVDATYYGKFGPLAEAIWAKDPGIVITVGDFAYDHEITDPDHITGSAVGLTSLDAQRRILKLAKEHGREVRFDVHVWTDGPNRFASGLALPSYVKALEKIADGADFHVCVYEYNSGNHRQRRAIGNALETNAIERIGERIAVVCSANCLQPDGQNDNDWDQGLLFLNPSKVWLQPPGYVLQMLSRNFQPLLVRTEVEGSDVLSVNAKRSEDGKVLVLQIVNPSDKAITTRFDLGGFAPTKRTAKVETLAGPLDARNTADRTDAIVPTRSTWRPGSPLEVPAFSVVVVRVE